MNFEDLGFVLKIAKKRKIYKLYANQNADQKKFTPRDAPKTQDAG